MIKIRECLTFLNNIITNSMSIHTILHITIEWWNISQIQWDIPWNLQKIWINKLDKIHIIKIIISHPILKLFIIKDKYYKLHKSTNVFKINKFVIRIILILICKELIKRIFVVRIIIQTFIMKTIAKHFINHLINLRI